MIVGLVAGAPPAHGARLYSTGFELNTTVGGVEFTSVGGAGVTTIVTSPVHSGTYAFKAQASANQANAEIRWSAANITTGVYWFRAYVYVPTGGFPSGLTKVISLTTSSGTQEVSVRLNASGTLELWNDDTNGKIGTTSAAMSADTWHRVEVKYDLSSSSLANVKLEAKLDGTAFGTTSGNPTSTSFGAGIGSFFVGPKATSTLTMYVDDVAVNDNTGTSQNNYPGEGFVAVLRPNAAGDTNQWLKESGGAADSANYALVNEVTPDDCGAGCNFTDFVNNYVKTTTTNAIDEYNLANATGTLPAGALISLVQVGARHNGPASAVNFYLRLKASAGGTLQESAAFDLGSTWRTNGSDGNVQNYRLTSYAQPGTSTAWTLSSLDSAQIGFRYGGGTETDVTAVWALIEYKSSHGVSLGSSVKTTTTSIGTNRTLALGSSGYTFILSGSGTVLTINGTLDVGTNSTVRYACSGNCTIASATYDHLDLNASSNAIVLTQAAGITLNGNMLLTKGQLNRGTCGPFGCSILVAGDWTTTSGATIVDTIANTYFNGTGTQNLTSAGMGSLGVLNIQGTGNTVVLQDDASGGWGLNVGTASASSGTLNMNGKNLTIGWGSVTVNAGGTFTKGAGTLTINGVFGPQTWTDNTATGQDFGPVTVANTGSTVNLGSNIIATSITLNGGTLGIGTYNLTVGSDAATSGQSITGAGTITASSPSVTALHGTGSLGGGTYTFYELQLSGGSRTTTLAGNITANGNFHCGVSTAHTCDTGGFNLTVGGQFFVYGDGTTNATFTANASTISVADRFWLSNAFIGAQKGTFTAGSSGSPQLTLSVTGTVVWGSGTFNAGVGTVTYTGSSASVSPNITYYNLQLNNASGAYTAGGALTATNNVTVTAGTFTAPSTTLTIGGSYSNSGTFTHNSGTVIFNATTAGKTLGGTMTGSSQFNNLTFNGAGGGWTASANVLVANNLTVTAGTLAMGANDLTVGATTVTNSGSIKVASGATLSQSSGNTTTLGSSASGSNCIGSSGASCAGTAGSITLGLLTIGDGSTTVTTTFGGTTPAMTLADLAIANAATFSAGTGSTITLSDSGTPLQRTGTGAFTAGTSTIQYTAGGGVFSLTSGAFTGSNKFYNLTIAGGGTFPTGFSLDVGNNATVSSGTLSPLVGGTITGTLAVSGSGVFAVGTQTVTASNVTVSGGTLSINGSGGKLQISGGGTFSMSGGTFQTSNVATTPQLTTSDTATPTYIGVSVTGGILDVSKLQVDYLKTTGFVINPSPTVTITNFNNVRWGDSSGVYHGQAGTEVILDVTATTASLLSHIFPTTWASFGAGDCNVRANTSGTVTMWDWSGTYGGEEYDCDNSPAEVVWKGGASGAKGSGSHQFPAIY